MVALPPLIGGFVGSDALACLAYFGFDQAQEPMAAIDLGTNGEVMVTDGENIVVASTAAGPAFEGVEYLLWHARHRWGHCGYAGGP